MTCGWVAVLPSMTDETWPDRNMKGTLSSSSLCATGIEVSSPRL